MTKVTAWAKNNKTTFNEEKSKFMIVSRRKRKENKEINIYIKNKPLQQVTKMKYLFKFSEHINYTAERSSKLFHSLSKSAKLTWGLNHEALQTI